MAMTSSYCKDNMDYYAKGISELKDILEDEIEEGGTEFTLPEKGTKLNIDGAKYGRLLQSMSDSLLIDGGYQIYMTIRPKEISSIGMSTLGICKPYTPSSYGSSKYRAGSINLLPLTRGGRRNFGPGVVLKYSRKQLRMKRSELNALLRSVGDLY